MHKEEWEQEEQRLKKFLKSDSEDDEEAEIVKWIGTHRVTKIGTQGGGFGNGMWTLDCTG